LKSLSLIQILLLQRGIDGKFASIRNIQEAFKVKNSTKAIMLSAAISGLLSGSTMTAYAAPYQGSSAGSYSLGQTASLLAASATGTDKHSCKGKNECKGTGGCKSSDNGCKAKNSCKGKGGCATDGSKS
jgi:hypothetical protein